jgi:hypothetical protein
MSEAPLEVEIDELTLHGFDPRDGGAIGEAVRGEIAEALSGWRPARQGAGSAAIDAGAVRVPASAAPRQVGRAVGARVARALRETDEDGAWDEARDAGAAAGRAGAAEGEEEA